MAPAKTYPGITCLARMLRLQSRNGIAAVRGDDPAGTNPEPEPKPILWPLLRPLTLKGRMRHHAAGSGCGADAVSAAGQLRHIFEKLSRDNFSSGLRCWAARTYPGITCPGRLRRGDGKNLSRDKFWEGHSAAATFSAPSSDEASFASAAASWASP